MSRSFTIVSATASGKKIKYEDGRFINETPREAVKKMFSKIHQSHKKTRTMIITLRETTQNSAKKEYKYKITKVPHKTEVERDGKTIVYKYVTKVVAI